MTVPGICISALEVLKVYCVRVLNLIKSNVVLIYTCN